MRLGHVSNTMQEERNVGKLSKPREIKADQHDFCNRPEYYSIDWSFHNMTRYQRHVLTQITRLIWHVYTHVIGQLKASHERVIEARLEEASKISTIVQHVTLAKALMGQCRI